MYIKLKNKKGSKDLKVYMKRKFIFFSDALKIRMILINRFLISRLVPEL